MSIQSRRDREPPAEPDIEPDGDSAALDALRLRARSTPPLDIPQLERLLASSAAGDRAGDERIVAANLALVIRLAEAREDRGLSLSDLIQEGSLGLVEAVRTFSGPGVAGFAAFAEARVGAQMDAAIDIEAAAVRDVRLLVTAATDYERTELLLRRELGRAPSESAIAEKLEWSVDRTRYVAQVVADARRRRDVELLAFIDPEAIELDEGEALDPDA